MVAIKSHQADNYVIDPPKGTLAYLIYGTDEGRISENAALLAKNWSRKFGDGGEIIQIDEKSLSDNPDILAIEVRSIPMFGGFSVIRTSLSNRLKPALIKELIALQPQNILIIEAGNLKPASAMRKLFDKSKDTISIACFPDETRDITRLIDEELTSNGIDVSNDARQTLISSLGSDRGISRQELRKLALFAYGKPKIEVADLETIIGDSSQIAYDQLIAMIMSGNGSSALAKLDRLIASGQTTAGLTTILGRHLARLYKVRAMIDNGRQAKDAINSLRPPVHFKQRDAMTRQAANLSLAMLKKALHLVQETVARSRTQSDLDLTGVERMIIILSRMSMSRH